MINNANYKKVDVAIIGAGLAGSSLLSEIIDDFETIALIEAGEDVHPSMKDIVTNGDYFHPSGDKYRRFGLGGSSSAWAGRCVPYDEQDFNSIHSWPIDYAELSKYYNEALKVLDANIKLEDIANLKNITGELFDVSKLQFDSSYDIYSKPTDTYRKFSRKFADASHLSIYKNHVVNSIDSYDKKFKLISGLTPKNKFTIKARYVVICNGGLEVTKLLLNLKYKKKIPISSALGKYYMTHYAGTVGDFKADIQNINYGYGTQNNTYVRHKYLFIKSKKQDLSFTARIHFPDIDDPKHSSSILSFLYLFRKIVGYEYGLRLNKNIKNGKFLHILNILKQPLKLIFNLFNLIIGRYFLERKIPPLMSPVSSYFNLDIHCEQSPSPNSNITLSNDIDRYGLYKLKVKWQPDLEDLNNLSINIQNLINQIAKNCISYKVVSKEEIIRELLRHGAFGGHFIGTTRMGNNPYDSVVDSNLKMHQSDNIFVLSSSTFPSSSHANPSLTIVALAIRLANQLKG